VTELDYADIQGTILRGYRVDYARHFVCRIAAAGPARDFLGALVSGSADVPQVTTAARWTEKPRFFLNVGITYAGLQALGVDATSLASFPSAFVRGATDPKTATLVGDVESSDPSHWIGGLADGTSVHLVVSLWVHKDPEALAETTQALRGLWAGTLDELSTLDAAALPDNKVHFGYTDNISQPHVDGAPPTKRPRPDSQPVAPPGEFLLGHPNQYDSTYRVQPEALSTNSSFAAFRMLEQDVVGFEKFLVTYGAQVGIDPELLAAKVCGRWRNGVPLVLSPDRPEPSPPIPPESINDYDYVSSDPARDDTYGYKCPVGSHMRRLNPRGERVLADGQHLHRIIRRAMPYGPLYDPGAPYDGQPRGLMGWFINADLQNQFEFLMSEWVNNPFFVVSNKNPQTGADPVKNISGQDPLLGVNNPAASSFTLSLPPSGTSPWRNEVLRGFSPFTTTRGGAYCYLPSITALRYLANLGKGGT
jgi:deferrochelatase/peroxidase EfeB